MGCLSFIVRREDEGLQTSLRKAEGLRMTLRVASESLDVSLNRLGGLVSSLFDADEGKHLATCYSLVCGTHTDREGAVLSASDGDLYDANNELIMAAE